MTIDRRSFIQSGTAAVIGMHLFARSGWSRTGLSPQARFRHLRLLTATPLDEMEHFYADVMQMRIVERTTRAVAIAAGETRLEYRRCPDDCGSPWYHVAFNIPENKIVAARDWQLERTELDNNPAAPRHPDHPNIVNFAHWDAHSVFFRDPAGNLLEHIARHTLANRASGAFTSRDILCCSEIALVLDEDDVRPGADRIGEALGLERYRTSSERFVALGDENGLVLIMRRGVSMRGQADVFETVVELDSKRDLEYTVPGFPYRIRGT